VSSLPQNGAAQEESWKFVKSPDAVQWREDHNGSFGWVDNEGMCLLSEAFPANIDLYGASADEIFPSWSGGNKMRLLLPQMVLNNKAELNLQSGAYLLMLKYRGSKGSETSDSFSEKARIIIGEMEFSSSGHVTAQSADWDRLLNNQRQMQLPP